MPNFYDKEDTDLIFLSKQDAAEIIRDVMGQALKAGTNITIQVNDASNQIVINSTATGGGGGGGPTLDNFAVIEYNGTTWPARPDVSVVQWMSPKYNSSVPRPPAFAAGDIWIADDDTVVSA